MVRKILQPYEGTEPKCSGVEDGYATRMSNRIEVTI